MIGRVGATFVLAAFAFQDPSWVNSKEFEGRHCRVRTDLPKKTAEDLIQSVDAEHERLRSAVRSKGGWPDAPGKHVVLLFKGEKGLQAVAKKFKIEVPKSGAYVPALKAVALVGAAAAPRDAVLAQFLAETIGLDPKELGWFAVGLSRHLEDAAAAKRSAAEAAPKHPLRSVLEGFDGGKPEHRNVSGAFVGYILGHDEYAGRAAKAAKEGPGALEVPLDRLEREFAVWLGVKAPEPVLDFERTAKRYEGKLFHVYSDMDEADARGLLDLLEKIPAMFQEALPPELRAPFPSGPHPVWLLASREEFLRVFGGKIDKVAGFYDPNHGRVVLCKGYDPMGTCVHEVAHLFAHKALKVEGGDRNTWFEEGFAEFLGAAREAEGKLVHDLREMRGALELFGFRIEKNMGYDGLAAYVDMARDEFLDEKRMELSYPHSALLVAFLASHADYAKDFPKLVDEIRGGTAGTRAIERGFGKSLEAVERDFRDWVLRKRKEK